jgi:hypothetical protein
MAITRVIKLAFIWGSLVILNSACALARSNISGLLNVANLVFRCYDKLGMVYFLIVEHGSASLAAHLLVLAKTESDVDGVISPKI